MLSSLARQFPGSGRLGAWALVGLLAAAARAAPGEWPQAAHDAANTRYSPLAEITTDNVARLAPSWTFSLDADRGEAAAPVVADGTMVVVTPFPNRVLAFDVSRPNVRLKWTFDPAPDPRAQGFASGDVVNRGAAMDGGRVFVTTLDGQVIALDPADGHAIWRHRLASLDAGTTLTAAPVVVQGRVVVGIDGSEFGVRGFLAALDASTGREAWRAYATGPDAEVRIGPAFTTPHTPDLGVSTWPRDAWRIGGGAGGGWVSYDPQLDLLYHGTGSPAPRNAGQRPGDDKWTATLFARRPGSGDAVWAAQLAPHDTHGHGADNESVLVDLVIGGRPRHVLLHAGRDGYLRVIDRATGELVSADPFVRVTTSHGVDPATGARRADTSKEPELASIVREACPSSAGAKNVQPSAWSPRTRLLYLPHQNLCEDTSVFQTSHIAGTPYLGAESKMHAAPGETLGAFTAWDPVARKPAWSVPERFPVWSGALATAGDLVFYGTMDGWFKAMDARDGRLLWRFKLPSGIVGQPVSFQGGDGRQYVAILSGVGGWAGLVVSHDLDPRDGTAAGGFVSAMKDLPAATARGGMLHVFRLP